MAFFVSGYDYEAEYTAEELETRSKMAVSACASAERASVVANWCQCACCRLLPAMSSTTTYRQFITDDV